MLITVLPVFIEWAVEKTGIVAGTSFFATVGSSFLTVSYIVLNVIVFVSAAVVLRDELGIVDQEIV